MWRHDSDSDGRKEANMRRIVSAISVALSALSIWSGYAQSEAGPEPAMQAEPAVITFISGNVDVDITPDNDREDFKIAELDMRLPRGSIVRTGRGAHCELTLKDGSILRISSTSVFKVEEFSFDEETGRKLGRFNLLFGRVKATVSKLVTSDSEFEVRSGTALAGIRGTTFGISYNGVESQILVFDGSVTLDSVTRAFEPLTIKQGRFSTVLTDGLPEEPSRIPKEVWAEWDEEFRVFSEAAAATAAAAAVAVPAAAGADEGEEAVEEGEEAAQEARKGDLDFGVSIGSITIENEFYNRWVFEMEYNRGKFGVGIFLPAIFTFANGIFAVDSWYNSDEWDFTDFNDAVHDLLIKFRYLKYGEDGGPVYFRLGSLERVEYNYGSIVDGYTNMLFFPQELTSGAVFSSDLNYVGLETFVARYDEWLQTSGARLFVRPLGRSAPLSIGGTLFSDRPKPDSNSWPAGPLSEPTQNQDQLPRIYIVGADAGIPLALLDSFSMSLYADVAKIGYRYKELQPALAGKGVQEGALQFLDGLGTAFGLSGTAASVVDYRAEYRYIRGYYEPGIINFDWENRRLTYQQELLDLILAQKDPTYSSQDNSGFYLGGGVKFLDKKLSVGLGYGYYVRYTGASSESVDRGRLYVMLEEGPVPRTYGSFTYDRFDNISTIFKDPFDTGTLLDFNLYHRLAERLTLSLNIKRTNRYNDVTRQFEPVNLFRINTNIYF
jgi:hypothetical protein